MFSYNNQQYAFKEEGVFDSLMTHPAKVIIARASVPIETMNGGEFHFVSCMILLFLSAISVDVVHWAPFESTHSCSVVVMTFESVLFPLSIRT